MTMTSERSFYFLTDPNFGNIYEMTVWGEASRTLRLQQTSLCFMKLMRVVRGEVICHFMPIYGCHALIQLDALPCPRVVSIYLPA